MEPRTHDPPSSTRDLREGLAAAEARGDERGGDHANRKGHKARTRTYLLHVV